MALNTARVRLKKLESIENAEAIQNSIQRNSTEFHKMPKRDRKMLIMNQTSKSYGFGKFQYEKKVKVKTQIESGHMEIFVNRGNKAKRDGKIYSDDSTVVQ